MKKSAPYGFKILGGNPSFGDVMKGLFTDAKVGVLCFEMGPVLRADLDDPEYEDIESKKRPHSKCGSKFDLSVFGPFLEKMRPGSDLALYFRSEEPSSLRLMDGEWELAHHCYDDAWSELFTYSEAIAKRISLVFKVCPIEFPGSINTPGGIKLPLE